MSIEPQREKLAVAPEVGPGDAHRSAPQQSGNGHLLIRLLAKVLESTALTVRLALLILVVAAALLVLIKAIPWDQFGQLLPAWPGK